MLRVNWRHTLGAFFQVMRVAVNYLKGQKQLEKNALKRTLARPPFHDRAYLEKLSSNSPGNPVGVRKHISSFWFVQPEKKSSRVDKIKETCFLTIFGNKSRKKFHRSQNLHQN